MEVEHCEGPRYAEQISVLEVKGDFNEEKLIGYLEEFPLRDDGHQTIWSIRCSRSYERGGGA